MDLVKTVSIPYTGTASAEKVLPDAGRKYLGLYAKSGTIVVSLGSGDHDDTGLSLEEGGFFEPIENVTNEVYASGDGNTLLMIVDSSQPAFNTYLGEIVYYDGTPVSWVTDRPTKLAPPVFR